MCAPFNAADQVQQGRVLHQVLQVTAMGCGYELDASLGDGAGRERFRCRADLVDHDHLRHVILQAAALLVIFNTDTCSWSYSILIHAPLLDQPVQACAI